MVRGSNPGPTKYRDHGHRENYVIAIMRSRKIRDRENYVIAIVRSRKIRDRKRYVIVKDTWSRSWNREIHVERVHRTTDDGQTVRILRSLNKDLFGYKIQYCIPNSCRTYTNFLMSLGQTYQECVESYTNLIMSLVKTYQKCVETYTTLFTSLRTTY